MFTGIVEGLGTVKKIETKKNLLTLTLDAGIIAKGTGVGDSVSLDGVCLTVTAKKGNLLTFDIMKETIDVTTLKDLHVGRKINLERALRADGRFSGHFVTGHIDGVGVIKKIVTIPNYVEFQVTVPNHLNLYMVPKGSVSIDGVSLTVGKVKKGLISVYLIPFTLEVTNLGVKKIGEGVNLEADVLAKYVLCKK